MTIHTGEDPRQYTEERQMLYRTRGIRWRRIGNNTESVSKGEERGEKSRRRRRRRKGRPIQFYNPHDRLGNS